MISLIKILGFDLRKKISSKGVAIFAIFALIGIFIYQAGIEKFKSDSRKKEQFISIETQKVKNYFSYAFYGMYGYRSFLFPSEISTIFNNSTTLNELHASIDAGIKSDFTKPENGGHLFYKPTGRSIDLSWYLYFVLSLLALAWGWNSFRNLEYIKFITASFSVKTKNAYFCLSLSKVLLIMASILSIGAIIWIQSLLNGISLNLEKEIPGLLSFLAGLTFVTVISFLIGLLFSPIENVSKSTLYAFLSWLIIIFLWTDFLNLSFYNESDKNIKSMYTYEIEKLIIITKFENMALNYLKEKGYTPQANKEMSEYFWSTVSKKIEAIELQMIKETRQYIKKFHLWSIFNPSSFYKSVNNELSSLGYNNFVRFYRKSIKEKREFTRYYLDKRAEPNTGKVEPFLSGDEYIFYSKPSLPHYFWLGVLVQILYIVGLFVIGYFRFERVMFPREKKAVFSNLDLKHKKGKHYAYNYRGNDRTFPDFVFSIFMGKVWKFTGKFSINGKNIVNREKKNFVYLPDPNALPGKVKVKAIINLFAFLLKLSKPERVALKGEYENIIDKPFGAIKDIEKVNLMLRMAEFKKADIYLLNNFFIDIRLPQTITEIKKSILKEDTLIIVLNSRDILPENPDHFSTIDLDDNLKYEEWIIRD